MAREINQAAAPRTQRPTLPDHSFSKPPLFPNIKTAEALIRTRHIKSWSAIFGDVDEKPPLSAVRDF